MEFNKRKFNIIVTLTICLICIVVVFASADFSAVTNVNPTTSEAEEQQTGEENESGEEQESSTLPSKKLPIFTNGWTAYNYALEQHKKLDSKIAITQSVIAAAPVVGDVTQNISKQIYCVGGVYYVKLTTTCANSFGENYVEYYVVSNGSISTKRDGGNIFNSTTKEYISANGVLPSEIPYLINVSTATLEFSNKSSESTYKLTFTLKESGYKNYLKNVGVTAGDGSNPAFTSPVKVVVRINKTTGRFASMSTVETYEISRMGFRIDCTTNNKMIFTYSGDNSTAVNEIKKVLGK